MSPRWDHPAPPTPRRPLPNKAGRHYETGGAPFRKKVGHHYDPGRKTPHFPSKPRPTSIETAPHFPSKSVPHFARNPHAGAPIAAAVDPQHQVRSPPAGSAD